MSDEHRFAFVSLKKNENAPTELLIVKYSNAPDSWGKLCCPTTVSSCSATELPDNHPSSLCDVYLHVRHGSCRRAARFIRSDPYLLLDSSIRAPILILRHHYCVRAMGFVCAGLKSALEHFELRGYNDNVDYADYGQKSKFGARSNRFMSPRIYWTHHVVALKSTRREEYAREWQRCCHTQSRTTTCATVGRKNNREPRRTVQAGMSESEDQA